MTTPLQLYQSRLIRLKKELAILDTKRAHKLFQIKATEHNVRRLSHKNPGVDA